MEDFYRYRPSRWARVFFDQLLIDARARNLFGITADDKLYCYVIGLDGHLFLKSETPFDAASGTAVIDSQTHYLYAADGDHSLLVYDVSNPVHLVRRQNIVTSITIQNVVVDQARRYLLLWGHTHTTGQGGSVLLRYSLNPQSQSTRKKAMPPLLQQGINALTIAGPYVVAGNESITLTVYSLKHGRPIRSLSRQPLLEADAAHLPSSIVYRRTGSLLYISTYYGAGSERAAQPASAIIVCHLGSGGQLGPQRETGKSVSNPRLYLDNTEHFLYVVSEEGTVDTYKIATDGQLAPVGKRLKVAAPAGIVFFSDM